LGSAKAVPPASGNTAFFDFIIINLENSGDILLKKPQVKTLLSEVITLCN